MASFVLSYIPNTIMSSTTTTYAAYTIPQPYSTKQDHKPFLKSNVTFHDQMLSKLGDSITTAQPSTSTARTLSSVWREIQGCNDWENLVYPLDPLLQSEIIRYGEFLTVCYKAFDLDSSSKRYLKCKYGKKNMLKEVGLLNSGYEVTKYIYATAPNMAIPIQPGSSSEARWVGYVAVSEDEDVVKRIGRRDILITFRGTVTIPEWMANLMSLLTSAHLDPHDPRPGVKVEAGFLSLYTLNETCTMFGVGSCRDQLLSEISRLIKKYKGEKLSITLAGHSMGSSLALLLAYDICELGLNVVREENIPVTVFSFAGPRVGNLGFKDRCEELGVKVLRIVNVNDPITKLPGVLFNESFRVFPWSDCCSCYAHVGVELLLDFFKVRNPSCVHDLESYIGLLKKSCKKVEKHDECFGLVEWAKGFVLRSYELTQLDGVLWENAALSLMNLIMFMCL